MAAPTLKQYLSSSLPTADWPNQSAASVKIDDNVAIFTAPSKLSQRVTVAAPFLRTWAVMIHCLYEADKAALEALWEDRGGRAKPFKWVHPEDGQTYFVHFGDSTITFQRLGSVTKAWTAALTLTEAHPAEINNDEGI
jgi:hypothetical protein